MIFRLTEKFPSFCTPIFYNKNLEQDFIVKFFSAFMIQEFIIYYMDFLKVLKRGSVRNTIGVSFFTNANDSNINLSRFVFYLMRGAR